MESSEQSYKINILHELGKVLASKNKEENEVYLYAKAKNPWFTIDFIQAAFDALLEAFLNKEALEKWLSNYPLNHTSSKKVGLIVAGNIPLVGLHDIICAYFSKHQILLKLSSKDDVLMNYFMKELALLDPSVNTQFTMSDSLKNIDAIIATGSNTTHQYFEYYFKNIPKILRKNRNSIAVLHGNESAEELTALADDVCMYFGLGCRNVSCLFVPKDFDITKLFPHFEKYSYMKNHVKYMNNYDYNRTLLLMNSIPHLSNDYIILQESLELSSRLAVLHYNYYASIEEINQYIQTHQEEIQCVVSGQKGLQCATVNYGESQRPSLSQYADNIDTLQFLINL